jgi:hypothetical protein
MATIHIHCGGYKTGSSSIQNTFWAQRDVLREQGWLYPRTGLMFDRPDVGVRHARLRYAYKNPEAWKDLVENLLAEIEGAGCPNVLISTEAWSHPGGAKSLRRFLPLLRARGHGVHGYVYLRNVAKYSQSLFRMSNRLGKNRLPFALFVDAKWEMLDLGRIASRLRSAFGNEMTPISFEATDDVVQDLSRRLGISVPAHARVRTNVGIGALDAEAQRLMTLAGVGKGKHRRHFPGAEALLAQAGIALESPKVWTERIPDSLRARVPKLRTRLERTGCLTASEIAALTALPAEGEGRDVTLLSALLAAQVEKWLAERQEPGEASGTARTGAVRQRRKNGACILNKLNAV